MLKALSESIGQVAGAWRWWLVVAASLVLDQATKIWANTVLTYDQPVVIFPSFNLTLRYNHGAAFSFLSDQGGWQRWFFTIIASVVSVALVVWISRIHNQKEKWLEVCALALILSGALGNLYDRMAYGYVIDFLEVYYGAYSWPAFNIADSAICIGAGLMFLDVIKNSKKEMSKEAAK